MIIIRGKSIVQDICMGKILFYKKDMELCMNEPFIIASEDLLPCETMHLPQELILGYMLRGGSVNSHAAILAKNMEIPIVVDIGKALKQEYDGELAIIDGYTGKIYIQPNQKTVVAMQMKIDKTKQRKAELTTLIGKKNKTIDGKQIKVLANASNLTDIDRACINDAEGIGLFRSESIYLKGEQSPSEEEQFLLYCQIIKKMGDKEVIIRTMDMGADNQAPYLKLDEEINPALGYRAIRISLTKPELFKPQLRAIYRASAYGNISIMYPMIISVEEVKLIKQMEQKVKEELRNEGIPHNPNMPSGIMIETPAAALISDKLAKEVDFFNVGTNDLIQYTLALDRQNAKLDFFYHSNHDAVLRLIEIATQNAHNEGIWIGICGELASDTSLTEQFVKMGIDKLSVVPGMILPIRKKIRTLNLKRE